MKHIKRAAALILALAMSLSLVSCGKDDPGAQSGEEQITLTIGIPNKVNVLDWDDNEFTKWLEETTGYNLEFTHFASDSGEAKSQLTTMMAGGEKLPDLILNLSLWPEERDQFGAEGYFVDMNTYLEDEEFMADFSWDESFENNLSEQMKELILLGCYDMDGHMYSLPKIMSSPYDTPGTSMFINQKWLDDLGLEMPTNMDELKEVATAFLTQDPNGNGQADEIPMLGIGSTNSVLQWIMENYSLGTRYFYNVDGDGNIFIPWLTDEYREGLRKINEFYDAGLIPDLNWTLSAASELAAITSPADGVAKVGIIGAPASTWAKDNTPLLFDYVTLPPFEGSYAQTNPIGLGTSANFITTDCEHPEAAMRLLLTICEPEGVRRQRYGVPDVDWVFDTDYDTGVRVLKILNSEAFTGQTKQTWGQETVRMSWFNTPEEEAAGKEPPPGITGITQAPEDRSWTQNRTALHRQYALIYRAANEASTREENILDFTPMFTLEESNELGILEHTMISHYTESYAKFCVGDMDINDDAVWAKYKADAEKLGAARAVEIQQVAYDRSIALLDK